MKKIISIACCALLIMSCNKSTDIVAPVQASIKAQDTVKVLPVASFSITNLNDIGNILELRALTIQNTSKNANSYKWDFGESANYSDGEVDYPIQFSREAEPANIYMVPCMQTVTIKLTAMNKAGDSSTTSQSFYVYCFRGVGGKHPVMHKLY